MVNPPPLSVTELTARIKQVLETGFHGIEVIGEISRLTEHASGHIYFSIKDAGAVISSVIWRSTKLRLAIRPREGRQYVFSGHISVYEPRGAYQLIVTGVREAGEGQLAAELERRKKLFQRKGYFEAENKLPTPPLPQRIGIVTSASAAALEDVKKVLATRPGWLELYLAPALVQGASAAADIAQAIRRLEMLPTAERPDVILLVRGGGSLEDLWCFNEETLVKAIVDCTIPIISGIGHEIDLTLSDMAADLRAATPSNAAELACPDRDTLRSKIPRLTALKQLLRRHIDHGLDQIRQSSQRQSYAMRLRQDHRHMHVERTTAGVHAACLQSIKRQRQALDQGRQRLLHQQPRTQLVGRMRQLGGVQHRLFEYQATQLQILRGRLATTFQAASVASRRHHDHLSAMRSSRLAELEALSPFAVLERGYAITTDSMGRIVSRMAHLAIKDKVNIRFHDGSVSAAVESLQGMKKP
ncbi:MAG: exodeoxyribonuclease VII large subunit [Mariprofundaceae bacterium]